jgi:uncharacterized protein
VFLTIMMIGYRFLAGWMWNRTGSLFVLGLLHAAGNAATTGSGFGDGVLRHLYPAQSLTVGVFHLLAFFALGVVVVLATRGRLGHTAKESEK